MKREIPNEPGHRRPRREKPRLMAQDSPIWFEHVKAMQAQGVDVYESERRTTKRMR